MTNTKLSDTMEEALAYLGRGSYRAHLEPAKRTLVALESRGMIEWANALEVGKTYDTTILWNVTAAGWAFLKDAYQIERPADAGRLTLDEALAEAYTDLSVRVAHPEMGTVRTAGPDTVTVDRDNGVCTRYVVSALHTFRSGDRVTIDGGTIRKPLPAAEYLAELDGPGGQLVLQRNPGGSCGFSFLGAGGSMIQCLGAAETNRTTCDVHRWHGVDMPALPVRQPGATDLDAGRFDLDQALSFAYGFGPTEEDRAAAAEPPGADQEANSHTFIGSGPSGQVTMFATHIQINRWLLNGLLHQHDSKQTPTWHTVCKCPPVLAANPEPPRRDGWLDQEAGSGPGAGPGLGDHRKITSLVAPQSAGFLGKLSGEARESIVFPVSASVTIGDLDVPLPLMDAVVREANRLTETRDAFARGSVYREHTPEDDMYVDRAAWKAEETRVAALREQLRTSARQRNTFEARNGRAPLCGREMSTGRPCPQHTPEDTREQYTKRDTYGDPIAYRDVPVPADLAGHWYGVEAISWTRGVNASYVQAVRIAKGLGL